MEEIVFRLIKIKKQKFPSLKKQQLQELLKRSLIEVLLLRQYFFWR